MYLELLRLEGWISKTGGDVTEYQIQWHWLPNLSHLPDDERIARYRELLHAGETLGWTPTEESLGRAHRPSERLGPAVRDGYITRIEVTRPFGA